MRKVILASGSPRRKELIAQMNVTFECIQSNYSERLDDARSMEDVAMELGLGKALEVAERYPNAFVIGADTIVLLEGKQLGKQPTAVVAKELLRQMSGKRVEVISSVALVCKELGVQEVGAAKAAIVYTRYGDDAIDRWLATDEWQDKAGATGVQHPDTPPVDHLEGDYDTILGISTRLVRNLLTTHGIKCKAVNLKSPHPIYPLAQTAPDAV